MQYLRSAFDSTVGRMGMFAMIDRPFVWRLADRHGVSGWVRNRGGDWAQVLEHFDHEIIVLD